MQFHVKSVALLAAPPWAFFNLVCIASALWGNSDPSAIFLCCSLSLGFGVLCILVHLRAAQGPIYIFLAFLCAVATATALQAGAHINRQTVGRMQLSSGRDIYSNVHATAAPLSVADAGAVEFVSGARPDLQHALGRASQDGHVYCVAPIIEGDAQSEIGFLAAGIDCCDYRASFDCGDAADDGARSGVLASSLVWSEFDSAARQASAAHGFEMVEGEPVFVFWTTNPDTALSNMKWKAAGMLLLATLISLPSFVAGAACLHWTQGERRNPAMLPSLMRPVPAQAQRQGHASP